MVISLLVFKIKFRNPKILHKYNQSHQMVTIKIVKFA